jgi:FkbM family methyltransferase
MSDVVRLEYIRDGGVPGGYWLFVDGDKRPYVTSTREFDAVELRETDVVVDLGAYCGAFSLRAARFPVARVFAYEPAAAAYDVLLRYQRLRNLRLLPAAVIGGSDSAVRFYTSRRGIGVANSTVTSRGKIASIVPAIRYEQAVSGATVVKIDVEGAEYDYQMVQPGIRALIVDWHRVGRYWRERAESQVAEIERHGFHALIKPKFTSGWACSGAWLREVRQPDLVASELLSGCYCCGCGAEIAATGKALCASCFAAYSERHRVGFEVGQKRDEEAREG